LLCWKAICIKASFFIQLQFRLY